MRRAADRGHAVLRAAEIEAVAERIVAAEVAVDGPQIRDGVDELVARDLRNESAEGAALHDGFVLIVPGV